MRRKDRHWASVSRHHSVLTDHRRPDSEQARELASHPTSLAAVTPQKASRRMVCADQRQVEQWYLVPSRSKTERACAYQRGGGHAPTLVVPTPPTGLSLSTDRRTLRFGFWSEA